MKARLKHLIILARHAILKGKQGNQLEKWEKQKPQDLVIQIGWTEYPFIYTPVTIDSVTSHGYGGFWGISRGK